MLVPCKGRFWFGLVLKGERDIRIFFSGACKSNAVNVGVNYEFLVYVKYFSDNGSGFGFSFGLNLDVNFIEQYFVYPVLNVVL
jgi:hypothetical protein